MTTTLLGIPPRIITTAITSMALPPPPSPSPPLSSTQCRRLIFNPFPLRHPGQAIPQHLKRAAAAVTRMRSCYEHWNTTPRNEHVVFGSCASATLPAPAFASGSGKQLPLPALLPAHPPPLYPGIPQPRTAHFASTATAWPCAKSRRQGPGENFCGTQSTRPDCLLSAAPA